MLDRTHSKSATEQFLDAIAAKGITPPDVISGDGKIHRFSSNGKPGNDAGWYAFHDGEVPTGSFGDFRTGQMVTAWVADIGRPLTASEQTDFKKKQADMKQKREADNAERRAAAQKKAAGILRLSTPAPDDHPYLVKKGIKSHGLRQWKDLLVIPMKDESGEVQSLQLIAGDGGKKFLRGGKMQGCFYTLGDLKGADKILIAEGYATAATIREATGFPVVVAYNAGNLVSVAKLIRASHPDAAITICADDDWKTEGNPGKTKAKAASDAVGGTVIAPEFGDNRPDKATDFNDMAAHTGKDAVSHFFTRHFLERGSDAEKSDNERSTETADEQDAILSSPEEPQTEPNVSPQLKRHFSKDELYAISQIWQGVPRRLTYHSEASYQIVIDGKDKILVTKDRIELSRKSRLRSDAAYSAACEHALQFWDGRMAVQGSQQHKIKAWAFASIHGVEVANFTPSDSERIEAEKIIAAYGKTAQPAERPAANRKQKRPRLDA